MFFNPSFNWLFKYTPGSYVQTLCLLIPVLQITCFLNSTRVLDFASVFCCWKSQYIFLFFLRLISLPNVELYEEDNDHLGLIVSGIKAEEKTLTLESTKQEDPFQIT